MRAIRRLRLSSVRLSWPHCAASPRVARLLQRHRPPCEARSRARGLQIRICGICGICGYFEAKSAWVSLDGLESGVPAPRGSSIVRTRLASGLVAVALLAATPAAQQPPAPASPPQPPTFRVGVGAVRVDVTVIGRNGLPVTDLTREDFEVREDGAVQRVQLFQHVRLTGKPRPAATSR